MEDRATVEHECAAVNAEALKNVTFLDARKKSPGNFHETGFTLIELDEEPITKDWRTSGTYYPEADVKNFHKQMEPHLRKLYPEVKRILWSHNVVRGGERLGGFADRGVAGRARPRH